MPWYQSPNAGRTVTIKNNCNLFIEVNRLGASGTAHVCESDSDFSNPFDSIFLRVEGVEAVEAGAEEKVTENSSRCHGCFCNGDIRVCQRVTAGP